MVRSSLDAVCHVPQAEKQTYGAHCAACDALWDGYQVPAPADVVMRALDGMTTCPFCQGTKTYSLMPWRYEQLKAERRNAHAAANGQAAVALEAHNSKAPASAGEKQCT